jgi:hypothetical protein
VWDYILTRGGFGVVIKRWYMRNPGHRVPKDIIADLVRLEAEIHQDAGIRGFTY